MVKRETVYYAGITAAEVHMYEVADTSVIGPYDNTVKNQSDEEILTLLTCANKGTKRFVCRCIPVKEAGDVDE